MCDICLSPCLRVSSNKISENTWNSNESQSVKQYDKNIVVVDRQPNSDHSKTSESVVDRIGIASGVGITNSVDSNDLNHNSRPNSVHSQSKLSYHNMDSSAPDTEYRQSYTWNKVVSSNSIPTEEPVSQTEYGSSFAWPQQSKQISHIVEPLIVAGSIVPENVAHMESSPRKSATISNFKEVVAKTDKEYQMTPIHEKQNKSEYNSKFKPFSAYLYMSGNGFIKPKNFNKLDEVDKARINNNWYSEVEERSKIANHYKTRSQLGHPLNSEGLTKIYSDDSLWNKHPMDRERQALDLATTQKIIEEKRQERALYPLLTPKSGHIRQLSSAPPSLRATELSISRTRSPHFINRLNSADRQPKERSLSGSPKPEGKIWLKPKPKTPEPFVEKKSPKDVTLNSDKPKSNAIKDSFVSKTSTSGPISGLTSQTSNDKIKKETVKAPTHSPLPSKPINIIHNKSVEEKTRMKSPPPLPVPEEKGQIWAKCEKPVHINPKPVSDVMPIKPNAHIVDKSKSDDKKTLVPSVPLVPSVATHTKPTAKVQPSPATSLSSIPNTGPKPVPIDEEVKIVKPQTNVLEKARSKFGQRLDQLLSRKKPHQ